MAIQLILRSAEVRLMETLNNIQSPLDWYGIHFHLEGLLEQYKSDYQVKIAINLINDLLKNYDGGIFLMADSSIIVLCYALEKTLRSKLIFQLRYLYMDDPLAYTEDGRENPDFATGYELSRQWQEFFDICSQRMAKTLRKASQARRVADGLPVSGMSAARLVTIERDLQSLDLSPVLRRQPVCAVMRNMAIRRVFDELYVSINHLRQLLKSEVDLMSNRWLFKHITQLLDARVIDLIRRNPTHYLDTAVSLNLNTDSLLTTWFSEFDAHVDPALKVSIIIEIPIVDVFADMNAFMAAKNEVQRLGYRVCLDGVTARSFTQLNREELGVDLVKVQWNADSRTDLKSKENRAISAAVAMTGGNRIVLCRCDSQQAVEYGQALGISLFQGRYIDTLFNPNSKVEN